MIEFGNFEFNNCIIKNFEPSKFTHSKFNGGNTSYNFYVVKPDDMEEDFFIIVNKKFNGLAMREAMDQKKPISMAGTILKNPKTHKTIYVISDTGRLEVEA